jgi:hypothetical protein
MTTESFTMPMPGASGGAKIVFTNTNLVEHIDLKNIETSKPGLTELK